MSVHKDKERSLVLIKPDALVRAITGHIINRLAHAGLRIVGAKVVRVSEELAREHYKHLQDQPFFEDLVKHIRGEFHDVRGILAFVYEGQDCIRKIREIAGATNPEQADPKSLRGQYGRITTRGLMENVIHASSDAQEAEREIRLWFRPEEMVD